MVSIQDWQASNTTVFLYFFVQFSNTSFCLALSSRTLWLLRILNASFLYFMASLGELFDPLSSRRCALKKSLAPHDKPIDQYLFLREERAGAWAKFKTHDLCALKMGTKCNNRVTQFHKQLWEIESWTNYSSLISLIMYDICGKSSQQCDKLCQKRDKWCQYLKSHSVENAAYRDSNCVRGKMWTIPCISLLLSIRIDKDCFTEQLLASLSFKRLNRKLP